jgi:hypothetical protein
MQATEKTAASILRKRPVGATKTKEDNVPPLVTLRLDSAVSISTSASSESMSNDVGKVYVPPPLVNQTSVLLVGFFIFILATIYPPLILLLAYMASKLIPYSFRVNDDAASRRRLFADFTKQDDLPDEFKQLPSHILLEESYWVNSRYADSFFVAQISLCSCSTDFFVVKGHGVMYNNDDTETQTDPGCCLFLPRLYGQC